MTDPLAIKIIIFDVDGVLTDGSLLIDDHGVESKRFHVRDGLAIKAATMMGLKIASISSRTSGATTLRLTELGVDPLLQGIRDKAAGLKTVCQQAQLLPDHAAYVGDDLMDLPAMLRCGYPIAVADAVDEVITEACFVTRARGGHGAAREAIEHILKTQGRWEKLVDRYAGR